MYAPLAAAMLESQVLGKVHEAIMTWEKRLFPRGLCLRLLFFATFYLYLFPQSLVIYSFNHYVLLFFLLCLSLSLNYTFLFSFIHLFVWLPSSCQSNFLPQTNGNLFESCSALLYPLLVHINCLRNKIDLRLSGSASPFLWCHQGLLHSDLVLGLGILQRRFPSKLLIKFNSVVNGNY